MDPMPTSRLTEEQVNAFGRHLASKGVNLMCPYCGRRYGPPSLASVPIMASDYQTPLSYTRPLVQVECTNCAHVALFDVPLPGPEEIRLGGS